MPTARKVEFYLFATDNQRPPNLGLAYLLADDGMEATREIVKRLDMESSESHIERLIYALLRMKKLGRMSNAEYLPLRERVHLAASRVRIKGYANEIQGYLAQLDA